MQADQKQQQAALQQGVQVVGYAPNGVPLVAAPMANPWAQMPVQYAYPYPPAPVYADPLTHAGQLAQHHVPLVSKPEVPKEVENLGTFGSFVKGLVGGFVFPIISPIVAYSMEATTMSRIGVLFGNGSALLWVGCYLISIAMFILDNFGYHDDGYEEYSYHYDYQAERRRESMPFWIASLPCLLLSIGFYIAGNRSFTKYMSVYVTPQAESARVKVSSPVGTTCHFVLAFLVSFLIPVVGSVFSLLACRSLKARYGSLLGMTSVFLVFGFLSTRFWYMSFITGNPALFLGLMINHCANVHFRRAIAAAEINALSTEMRSI